MVRRFVEIYQDCNIFNHKAFAYATDKDTKEDNIIRLEHGKPLNFGKESEKGIMLDKAGKPQNVVIGENGVTEEDILIHDETDESMAFMLSRMKHPDFPEPMGVFYRFEDDCYEDLLDDQVTDMIKAKGEGSLKTLFESGDTYTVGA